ncbi:MAG: DedA family protein [Microlunatus sp.]|nr:DedA family protein [Microlunatus sp.]
MSSAEQPIDQPDAGAVDDAGIAEQQRDPEWWEDPRMPWKGKPGRADILCWVGFSVSGLIGLIMIPLRPILIGHSPLTLVAITGSRSGLVTSGALGAVGRADWWPIALVVGIVSSMKWDPLFWWAGRLWGRGLIDVVAGRSRWAARTASTAERLARRFGIPAVLLCYLIPLPAAVVYATVGMAGMRLRTFILVDLLGSAIVCSLYVYLGFRLGHHAVAIVDLIAKYSGYISLALLAAIVINAILQANRRGTGSRAR